MGVIVPVGEAQVSFIFTVEGGTKEMTWTLGIKEPNVSSPSLTAVTVRDAFITSGMGDERPYDSIYISDLWTFVGVRVAVATGTGPLVGEVIDPIPGSLTTGDTIPKNCAMLLNKSTGTGGRRGRGRAYIPPLHFDEQYVNQNGIINTLNVTELTERYNNALEDAAMAALVPCLHHDDGSAGTPIISVSVGNLIATQRRRLR